MYTRGMAFDEVLTIVGKYAGFGLTTFVCSGLGAYLGSYLKKKAENKAVHEDIQKLVDQMRAVTNATKEIEAKISTDMWHRQNRWEMRKDAILEALRDFGTAAPLVWKMLFAFSHHREDSEEHQNARSKASEEFQSAMESFWRSKLTATIVCGPAVSKQLNDIDVLVARVKVKVQKRAFTEAWGLFDEVNAATDKLAESVRDELGFEVNITKITPQPNESSATSNPN
jgi:hypothetical protein